MPYSAQLSSLTFAVTGNCAWAALPALHLTHLTELGKKRESKSAKYTKSGELIHNVHGLCMGRAASFTLYTHQDRVGKKWGVKKP